MRRLEQTAGSVEDLDQKEEGRILTTVIEMRWREERCPSPSLSITTSAVIANSLLAHEGLGPLPLSDM